MKTETKLSGKERETWEIAKLGGLGGQGLTILNAVEVGKDAMKNRNK